MKNNRDFYVVKGVPKEKDYERIKKDYYCYSEMINGENVLKNISLKMLAKPEANELLLRLDPNYKYAIDRFYEIYYIYHNQFYGLYSNKHVLIAHTTAHFISEKEKDTFKGVIIKPIYILNRESLLPSKGFPINIVNNINKLLISCINDDIKNRFDEYEDMNFYIEVLENQRPTLKMLHFSKQNDISNNNPEQLIRKK